MHVYLRDEPITLRMEKVDAEGLVPEGSDLLAIAFFANENQRPSFRALLPPETVALLNAALHEPVTIGLLAEEPAEPGAEIRAMVGISVPVNGIEEVDEDEAVQAGAEPWSSDTEAWRGRPDDDEDDDAGEAVEDGEPGGMPRAALLAFAPLVRLSRKHPDDFSEELADLLESALAGDTRPSLEARVERMLGDL